MKKIPVSELVMGKLYLVDLEANKVFAHCPMEWSKFEVVRIEDGLYRRFPGNSEDRGKLYRTFQGQDLSTIYVRVHDAEAPTPS
jgi:hypothetical protein